MITIIAAFAKNNELGRDNDLIWYLPADLKRFKQVTTGHHIIMGRNTYDSIGKPLPNRTSVIVTRNTDYQKEGCLVANSLEQALEMAKEDEQIFIIGGAQIYEYAVKQQLADVLDITFVHEKFEADVYFPKIDPLIWKKVTQEDFEPDEKNKYSYSFIKYKKITN
ncbi:dihydrofolate reductase [Polaribacter sp.]|uniref:dihydrofolate reductase n=1 Tax=Polaribacter sp. TaxID=1920175 RepID=UPI0025D4E5C0|nr:dihydrofolate reductase [Polaribacter sp.]